MGDKKAHSIEQNVNCSSPGIKRKSVRFTGSDDNEKSMPTNDNVLQLSLELQMMKMRNDRLIHEQGVKHGTTVDITEQLSKHIFKAIANNASLLAEIENSRIKFDNLHGEMKELRTELANSKKELTALRNANDICSETNELLVRSEIRSKRIRKLNTYLRASLQKDSCKSSSVRLSRSAPSTPRTKASRARRPINAVPVRDRLSPKKIEWTT
ncbi:hypothetical protein DPMN_025655 [Dreissena polymorpha]|uniref:Uncharacterized protein n=1 Tax=Dreissena polymorpha TaxID=45954 RepID=A0A9D4RDI6_DREPO|nr:hypothetical protein DPMN_025655 [Dreissena polymorpha]